MTEIREIDAPAIMQACERLASEVALAHAGTERLMVVGITNGGVLLGQRLAGMIGEHLGRTLPVGQVNITFHRDDIGTNPIPKEKEGTQIPGDVTGYVVLLADDVIASGRTIRAALNELFDSGRPAKVELAVLCDRGGRKLPVQPDYLGFVEEADSSHRVRVTLDLEHPEHDRIVVLKP